MSNSNKSKSKDMGVFEIFLIITVIGLTALLFRTSGYKMIVLNLFYLPVILAAFFLGRYRAGVFCLLCIVSASIVTVMDLANFAAIRSPVVIGLAVTVWGAVLGLTALLVGTLSDERASRIRELNEAYVGVIEVLSRYLQSGDQHLRARSIRVAELSQQVAEEMKVATKQLDDIRVAALLYDMENFEITAKVIQKAVGSYEAAREHSEAHTFTGNDLAHSLGSVLTGAFPILVKQSDSAMDQIAGSDHRDAPLGARIIRTVRAYDMLLHGQDNDEPDSVIEPLEAIDVMKQDSSVGYDSAVLDSLAQIVGRKAAERTVAAAAV